MRISDWSSDVCSSDLSSTNADGSFEYMSVPEFHTPFLNHYMAMVEDTESPRLFHLWSAITGAAAALGRRCFFQRSEEHTSELQSLMRISYAVFCLKKEETTQVRHAPVVDMTLEWVGISAK